MEVEFRFQYSLSRKQRLVPHIFIWAKYLPVVAVYFVAPLILAIHVSAWWWGVTFIGMFSCRGFFWGFIDVALRPSRHMDIVIKRNGLGFLSRNERWWVFLDGILHIDQLLEGTWTIQHHNGTVIHIPTDLLTAEQLEFIRSSAPRLRKVRATSGAQESALGG